MNHVKGVGHRKPPVQSRIKTSLNLSIVKAMQSLAHYWWNHTSFRIKKVYFRHTFDIFSWRALNYAVLIITDYEMHLLGYKIQLLKRILRKAHYIFKSREPCFKLCMHSWTKHFNAFTVSSPSFLSEISGFFSYNSNTLQIFSNDSFLTLSKALLSHVHWTDPSLDGEFQKLTQAPIVTGK